MTFASKPVINIDVLVNGQALERVNVCKYLGIFIDSELKWTHHIDYVYCKLVKFASIFYKLRDRLPAAILKQIYYAFVNPHILYGVELYANTHRTYLDKLMKLNNKLLRILQSKPVFTPVNELYACYNALQITDLHKLQLLVFVHKFMHHKELLPAVFVNDNYFIINEQVHSYNTRTRKDIHMYSINMSFGQRCVKNKAAGLWNDLPQHLKRTLSVQQFKFNVKNYLLSMH